MSTFGGGNGTFSGLMQIVGGWLESIARTPTGFRVRTALGNSLQLSHDDTDATVESTVGKLNLSAPGGVEFPNGLTLPVGTALPAGVALPADTVPPAGKVFSLSVPSTGNTAARPVAPVLGLEYFDTDLDSWIKWNGSEWRYLTEAVA